MPIGVPTCRF